MSLTSKIVLLASILTLVLLGDGLGAPLVNGDFSAVGIPPDPFQGWTTDESEIFGFVRPTRADQYALFSETGQQGNIELLQLFTIPQYPLTLSFDFRMDVVADLSPPAYPLPPDSFQATLYDASWTPLFPADPAIPPAYYHIDNFGDTENPYDPTFVSVTTLADGWRRVALDISSLPPEDVRLEFILNIGDDGRTTSVSLDNVAVTAVPEPASLQVLAGLFGLLLASRRLGWRRRLTP